MATLEKLLVDPEHPGKWRDWIKQLGNYYQQNPYNKHKIDTDHKGRCTNSSLLSTLGNKEDDLSLFEALLLVQTLIKGGEYFDSKRQKNITISPTNRSIFGNSELRDILEKIHWYLSGRVAGELANKNKNENEGIKKLREENKELCKEITGREEEYKKQNKKIKSLEDQILEQTSKIMLLTQNKNDLKNQLKLLEEEESQKNQISENESKNPRLSTELAGAFVKQGELQEKISLLEGELKQYKNENEKLKQEQIKEKPPRSTEDIALFAPVSIPPSQDPENYKIKYNTMNRRFSEKLLEIHRLEENHLQQIQKLTEDREQLAIEKDEALESAKLILEQQGRSLIQVDQLNNEVKDLKAQINDNKKLAGEKKQLTNQVETLRNENIIQGQKINGLQKENGELKQTKDVLEKENRLLRKIYEYFRQYAKTFFADLLNKADILPEEKNISTEANNAFETLEKLDQEKNAVVVVQPALTLGDTLGNSIKQKLTGFTFTNFWNKKPEASVPTSSEQPAQNPKKAESTTALTN